MQWWSPQCCQLVFLAKINSRPVVLKQEEYKKKKIENKKEKKNTMIKRRKRPQIRKSVNKLTANKDRKSMDCNEVLKSKEIPAFKKYKKLFYI